MQRLSEVWVGVHGSQLDVKKDHPQLGTIHSRMGLSHYKVYKQKMFKASSENS